MTVWLVCDASGSMAEGGKRFITRGLVREVEQFVRLGFAAKADLKLVVWRDHATEVAWRAGDEVPQEVLDCHGSAEAEPLLQLLGEANGDRYLLLTDGFWSDDSRRLIKRWRNRMPTDSLRLIKVGTDANPRLSGDGVFEAEDFFAATDGWLLA